MQGWGLYVLLLFQVYASFEQARSARQAAIPAGYRLVPPLKPIAGRYPGLRFRFQSIAIALAGTALSVLVFLGYPREIGTSMLGSIRGPAANRTPHFSREIDLNIGGRITDSRAKVFSLQLTDDQGRIVHRNEPMLLRGAVLDDYRGHGRWGPPRGSLTQVLIAQRDFTPLVSSDTSQPNMLTQHIVLNRPASGEDPIFSVYAPRAVAIPGGAALLYELRAQALMVSDESRGIQEYFVKAQPGVTVAPRTQLAGPLRDADSAIARLAWTILQNEGIGTERSAQWNRKAVEAFTEYLQNKGGYTYTTDLAGVKYPDSDQDPIGWFLLKSKRGHCEFFASGLVALCRSVNIPSRIAVGYVAYEYDEDAKQYDVMERNAHAWVEAQVGDGDSARWQTFDPTPPSTLITIHSGQSTLADHMRWTVQSLEGNWNTSVVGFDGMTQAQLADTLNRSWSARFSRALGSVRDWMEGVNRFFNVGVGGYIWMGIVALALVIAVIALVKLMRRSLAIRRTLQLQHLRGAEYQRMLRQLGFYLDMLRVLKHGGMPKPHWQPPRQFAGAIVAKSPRAGELVGRITDAFYAARYGHRRLDREQIDSMKGLVQELAAALKVRM
jgi:transglutaminase-like putative cysteine protease